jgi:uncharacterized protein YecE (DUF72 family)
VKKAPAAPAKKPPAQPAKKARPGAKPEAYQRRSDELLPILERGGYTSTPMSVVACSGFPVPVSRYWREFEGVEISETELGIPGAGTVRRWLREAPEGFVFTLLAPKDIVTAGFELNEATDKLVKEIGNLCKTMKAHAVVFAAPPEFAANRANKAALKKFVEALPARYPKAVLSLPAWKLAEVNAAIDGKKGVIASYDPLQDDPSNAKVDFAYVRMPGPAGHRSRYDEGSLERLVAHLKTSKAKQTVCVFHNIDMHANATRTRELLASNK